jgi:hypothetical protein
VTREDALVDRTKETVAALRRLAVKQSQVTRGMSALQARMAKALSSQATLALRLVRRVKQLEARVARLSA